MTNDPPPIAALVMLGLALLILGLVIMWAMDSRRPPYGEDDDDLP